MRIPLSSLPEKTPAPPPSGPDTTQRRPFPPRPRRRLAVLILATLVGMVAAAYNARGHLEGGVATAHVMIDFPGPSIVDRRAMPQDVSTLQKHAELYARVLTSQDALDA